MIKLTAIRPHEASRLESVFSDGSHGIGSAADLIARNTALTMPLANPDYFSAHSLMRVRSPGTGAGDTSIRICGLRIGWWGRWSDPQVRQQA